MMISSKEPLDLQLNPNHPTYSRAHLKNIKGTLWDLSISIMLLLRPMASVATTPEILEQMCTTVSPAKSCTAVRWT